MEIAAMKSHSINECQPRFGDLNPRRGLSGDIALYEKAQSGGKEEYLTEGGEALVEIEPVKYELRSIDFDHRDA